MLSESRSTKVFTAALISIGIGAVALKIMGSSPPPAGAFSLSEYYHLFPIEKAVSSNIAQTSSSWECIEIDYSGANADDAEQGPSLSSLVNYEPLSYHFIVWNGDIGEDGQIEVTQEWQEQRPIAPTRPVYGSEQTIQICVITDGKLVLPTNSQIKRTEALVEVLSRRFNIQAASICYPDNWW